MAVPSGMMPSAAAGVIDYVDVTFDRAMAFASLVCGHRGAVIPDRGVYTSLLDALSDTVAADSG